MTHSSSYEEQLAREGEVWGRAARDLAARIPPDWREHRHRLRHNIVMQGAYIDEFLSHIRPGMRVLDLGCGAGWLTLAMAQRGAEATGIDISEESLNVAREYYESIREEVPGSARYELADLNHLSLAADSYDVIAVCGALHHLTHVRHTIEELHKALRPGGLFWGSDIWGDEPRMASILAGTLMFLLPIEISYREKISSLFRFGLRSPDRVKAAIEGEGFSPFEGAGREGDWLQILGAHLDIYRKFNFLQVTKFLAGQDMIRLPDRLALPILRGIAALERGLLHIGWLRGTGLVVYARKARKAAR